MCENLVNALKLSANQQLGCDSLVQELVEGLEEGRRLKMTRELVDGHEAITIGDLEATFVSLSIVEPEFNKEDFPQARLRGTVELTPRKGEVVDGAQSSWTRTGTPSAKPSSATSLLQGGQHSEAGQQFEGNGFVDAEGRKDNWRSESRLES